MEIDLNEKDLGDDGLAKVLVAITYAIQGDGKNGSNFHLEELHLSKNGLTTAALDSLSLVVQMSLYNLRALDLSGNDLRVVTDEQAHLWEQFLDSFRTCKVMRRLDLSGNDFSKSLAMEVLYRVYSSHKPIDPNDLEATAPIDDDMAATRELHGSKLIEKTNVLTLKSSNDSFIDPNASADSLCNAIILKKREGLRSIPYIVLRNIGMTDAGALHLSNVLRCHYWPQYLMTKLKEGSQAAKIKQEDDSTFTNAFGVIYVDNPNITATGLKTLQMAEQARVGLAGISEMSGRDKDDFQDPIDFSTQ